MIKEDLYFIGWESEVFGFGYGTGENRILPSLVLFMKTVPLEGTYDYEELERKVGSVVAWMFINALCKADNIEYGSSPRYGWLTDSGKRLQKYILSKSEDELYELVMTDFKTYEEIEPKDNLFLHD